MADVRRWAGWIARAVVTGELDAEPARIATSALGELRRAIEKDDLQQRVHGLQDEVKRLRREGGR